VLKLPAAGGAGARVSSRAVRVERLGANAPTAKLEKMAVELARAMGTMEGSMTCATRSRLDSEAPEKNPNPRSFHSFAPLNSARANPKLISDDACEDSRRLALATEPAVATSTVSPNVAYTRDKWLSTPSDKSVCRLSDSSSDDAGCARVERRPISLRDSCTRNRYCWYAYTSKPPAPADDSTIKAGDAWPWDIRASSRTMELCVRQLRLREFLDA